MAPVPTHTDVFIAGGGPAGLAAAIAARARGLDVTVADHGSPAIDKACGEGLMPYALEALSQLGVSFTSGDGYPFDGIRFLGPGASVAAKFPQGTGLGVRRTTLHRILAERAEHCGVHLLWNSPFTGISRSSVTAGGHTISCRYVVGADGGQSAVRRWVGLDARIRDHCRYGYRRHYQIEPWTSRVEVHWSSGCQIYITPVAPDQVCVALLSENPSFRLDEALPLFPALASRLRDAPQASTERGSISASRRLRRVVSGNVALIGDASGSVDAVTGEGMSIAFRQALALAKALQSGRLEDYQREHEAIRRHPAFMADLLLLMDRRDTLRRRVLAALSARPKVFAGLLAMHDGPPAPRLIFTSLLSLGWTILTN
jgi:flavin-dependent dehydrogenase